MVEIYLNVYDLPDQTSTNNALSNIGLGFYHSGVEYNGYEYSFSQQQGVIRTRPCLPDFGVLREHLMMGQYMGTKSEFENILNALRTGDLFSPGQYHVVHRNCNHFSEALCMSAIGVSIPAWVNRAASIGWCTCYFVPFAYILYYHWYNSIRLLLLFILFCLLICFCFMEIGQNVVPTSAAAGSASNNSSGGGGAFASPGVVSEPSLKGFAKLDPATTTANTSNTNGTIKEAASGSSISSFFSSIFGFSGGSKSASGATSNVAVSATASITSSSSRTTNSSKKAQAPTSNKQLTEKQKEILAKLKK
jgi:hypothetical protein